MERFITNILYSTIISLLHLIILLHSTIIHSIIFYSILILNLFSFLPFLPFFSQQINPIIWTTLINTNPLHQTLPMKHMSTNRYNHIIILLSKPCQTYWTIFLTHLFIISHSLDIPPQYLINHPPL